MSAGRRARTFVLNLLATLVSGPLSWPPVDIVLIDMPTGRVLKTWHEGGDDASTLLSVLNAELAEMPYGEFMQKWDIPTP